MPQLFPEATLWDICQQCTGHIDVEVKNNPCGERVHGLENCSNPGGRCLTHHEFKRAQRPIYYVSGPITGQETSALYRFGAVASRLRALGLSVVNPVELTLAVYGALGADVAPWGEHLKRDLHAAVECDGVVLLEGWYNSAGARLEVATMVGLGHPAYVLAELEDHVMANRALLEESDE
jgi:hypothetical protein